MEDVRKQLKTKEQTTDGHAVLISPSNDAKSGELVKTSASIGKPFIKPSATKSNLAGVKRYILPSQGNFPFSNCEFEPHNLKYLAYEPITSSLYTHLGGDFAPLEVKTKIMQVPSLYRICYPLTSWGNNNPQKSS